MGLKKCYCVITVFLLLSTLFSTSAIANDLVTDVSQEDYSGGTDGNGLCSKDDVIAQSFITSLTKLSFAFLRLKRERIGPYEKVTLTISRSRNGDSLTSKTIPCQMISYNENGALTLFDFPDVDVSPGAIYWVKLSLNQNPDENNGHLIWLSSSTDVYLDGKSWAYSDSTGWFERKDRDQTFTIKGYKDNSEDNDDEHYVVIACGGLDKEDQGIFETDAYIMYQAYHEYLGYDDDHIYYLDRSKPNGYDASTTKENMKYAIKEWLSQANQNSKICIYITDHGSANSCIWVSPNERISSYELANWIKNLEYKSLSIIIQCCYAGNFIDDLKGKNKIILASTDDGAEAHYTPYGCSMFTGSIGTWIGAGNTYGGAFDTAKAAVQNYDNPQMSDQSGIAYETYPQYNEDESNEKNIQIKHKKKNEFSNILLKFPIIEKIFERIYRFFITFQIFQKIDFFLANKIY